MVLLPGCVCCKSCGPPQLSDMPDSIEVDLETASNRSASLSVGFTTTRPSISYAATMPNITATYQLAKVTSLVYQYNSPTVSLSLQFGNYLTSRNGFAFAAFTGSVGILNISAGVNCRNTFIDFNTTRTCDFATTSLGYSTFQALLRENNSSSGSFPRLPCNNVQGAVYGPNWNITAASSAKYTEACRLPVRLDMYMVGAVSAGVDTTGVIGFDSYTGLSSTFDYCTPTTFPQPQGNSHVFEIGFFVSFTVKAMRLVYESTSAPYFDDIGYTGCTVTP